MKLERLLADEITLPAPSKFGISTEAEEQRAGLILKATAILAVTTPEEANQAADAARALRTLVKETQAIGLELRRPISDLAARVKFIEDDFCNPMVEEQRRLERLANDFAAAERRRVAAEEQRRQAEIARLEAERRAAERRAQEEQDRIARENREAEEKARQAEAAITNKRQLAAAMKAEEQRKAEMARRQAEADAAAEQARQAAARAQSAIRQPLPTVHKATGMATKRSMAYEVTDLTALYAARPELCTLEAKASAIRAVCVPRFPQTSDEVDTSIPGLRLWWTDTTSTRAFK